MIVAAYIHGPDMDEHVWSVLFNRLMSRNG
jgi:hypothetical protein